MQDKHHRQPSDVCKHGHMSSFAQIRHGVDSTKCCNSVSTWPLLRYIVPCSTEGSAARSAPDLILDLLGCNAFALVTCEFDSHQSTHQSLYALKNHSHTAGR